MMRPAILLRRQDNRGITTGYSYDALNRMIRRSSTDSSLSGWYYYDQNSYQNPVGRLTQVAESVVNDPGTLTTYGNADSIGNVKQSTQSINNVNYNFSYSYNLGGALTGETYPSGRNLQISYDGVDRPTAVTGAYGGNSTNYVSNVNYFPHGAPNCEWYGKNGPNDNSIVPCYTYNSRLQPDQIYSTLNNDGYDSTWVQYFAFDWGSSNNNGNLLGMFELTGNFVIWSSMTEYYDSFGYDAVNRLTGATDSNSACGGTCWSRGFGYDQWGNMWVSSKQWGAAGGQHADVRTYSTPVTIR